MAVKMEGIWYPHKFGGWRILIDNQCVGIYDEFNDAEIEYGKIRAMLRCQGYKVR